MTLPVHCALRRVCTSPGKGAPVSGPDLSDWAVVVAGKSRFLCALRVGMTRGLEYDTPGALRLETGLYFPRKGCASLRARSFRLGGGGCGKEQIPLRFARRNDKGFGV